MPADWSSLLINVNNLKQLKESIWHKKSFSISFFFHQMDGCDPKINWLDQKLNKPDPNQSKYSIVRKRYPFANLNFLHYFKLINRSIL
jgi:hypothetical protein